VVVWVGLAVVLGAGAWGVYRVAHSASRRARRAAVGKLNVLLITADTTRADYLGCYGREGARTPNIDRLSDEGTLFTRCTTCSPFTLPSHSSILTAVYPYVHGARRNGTGRLAEANVTLAEALQEAGYRTQATVASFVLNREFGTAQGFEVYRQVVAEEARDALHAERKGDEVCADALEMLRGLAEERFFLWVHFYDPHYPYESARVPDTESPAAYEDEITFMDTQIGRLLHELARLGLERETLVVLVGDHGEGLGQHDELRHGTFLYDTTLHVPLVLRCPTVVPKGKRVTARVRTIDVAPTILDLVGRPPLDHAQGVALRPLLSGKKPELELAAYAESLDANDQFGLSLLRSLSAGDWKYILAPKPELYNLASDAGEADNRQADEPSLATRMREQLRMLLAAAPPPPAKEHLAVTLDDADIARLESLGYVASVGDDGGGLTELDRFEPQGGNPKDYAQLFTWKAQATGAMGRKAYGEAERLLRQLVEAVPDAPQQQVELANAVLQQGRLNEALGIFERAVAMTSGDQPQASQTMPNLPRVQLNLAVALRGAGRLEEALKAYQRAVAMAPDYGRARWAYGNFLLFAGRKYAEAATQLAIALEYMPDDLDTLHDLGVALTVLGKFDQAERYLQRALQNQPNAPRVLQAMGILRLQQRRLREAAEYFRKTLKLKPNSPEAKAALQRVQELMRLGRDPG
jgi:arylsulfatase A-like enzyme/Tfp pilus assembly protein PilF